MRVDPHARAKDLINRQAVEGIAGAEREWLEQHISECEECASAARSTQSSIRQLRSIPVSLPPDLAARAQLRVYLRAREPQPRSWALWVSFALCWLVGVASAPLVWRGFEWFGHVAGVPPLALKLAFGLWWALPAAGAALIWSWEAKTNE